VRQTSELVSIERSFHSLNVPAQPPPAQPARWQPALWVAVGILVTAVPTLLAGTLLVAGMFWWSPQEEGISPAPVPAEEPVVQESAPEEPIQGPRWQVTSQPLGADVFSGETKLGKTPLELVELPPGPLTLKLAGHKPAQLSLEQLKSESTSKVTLTRAPAPAPVPVAGPEPFKPDVRTTR
jgi:hypothetical protein